MGQSVHAPSLTIYYVTVQLLLLFLPSFTVAGKFFPLFFIRSFRRYLLQLCIWCSSISVTSFCPCISSLRQYVVSHSDMCSHGLVQFFTVLSTRHHSVLMFYNLLCIPHRPSCIVFIEIIFGKHLVNSLPHNKEYQHC